MAWFAAWCVFEGGLEVVEGVVEGELLAGVLGGLVDAGAPGCEGCKGLDAFGVLVPVCFESAEGAGVALV